MSKINKHLFAFINVFLPLLYSILFMLLSASSKIIGMIKDYDVKPSDAFFIKVADYINVCMKCGKWRYFGFIILIFCFVIGVMSLTNRHKADFGGILKVNLIAVGAENIFLMPFLIMFLLSNNRYYIAALVTSATLQVITIQVSTVLMLMKQSSSIQESDKNIL